MIHLAGGGKMPPPVAYFRSSVSALVSVPEAHTEPFTVERGVIYSRRGRKFRR